MRHFLIFIFILFNYCSKAQSPIFELNKKLGRGINMGNMFEAPDENAWGNPYKDDYFSKISKLGFQHVRIPIRWDVPARANQNAPYTLNGQFLSRIKKVVDDALAQNLMVIINMHHHELLFEKPEENKQRFLAQWQQIADFFKNYDDRLLFEILNEPHGELTPEKWNVFFADAVKEVRKTNPNRALLLGCPNFGGLSGVPPLKVPEDKNIILSIHYYDPFNFTHQGADWVGTQSQAWLGTKWEDQDLERNEIINQFQYAKNWSLQNQIPIHIGEFGAYSKADINSRVKWTTFLSRWFESNNWSWAYWEFSAGFGIYNPSNGVYNMDLIDALLKNPMPEPKKTNVSSIYKSDFLNSQSGWNLSVQGTALAEGQRKNGQFEIEIKTKSDQGWHVQWVKSDISLTKGKQYLVTFEASSTNNYSYTVYIGKSISPFNAYSGYKGFTSQSIQAINSFTFTMNDPSDNKARLVFDLGQQTGKLNIKEVNIYELSSPEVLLSNQNIGTIRVYPNPFIEEIKLSGVDSGAQITIFNINGKEVFKGLYQSGNSLKFKSFSLGSYYMIVENKSSKEIIKIIKNE